ncbi:MAG: hypothetical protein PHS14_16470 [Elusimicrobia bacterium]|nr:hypothetical protein [Elusimicrobiota bacterium]
MKKLITVAGLIAVCLVIAAKSHAYTPTSGTKIAGSAHDFTVAYTGVGGVTTPAINQCSTCHEMHKPAKMAPLWGRMDPTATGWSVQSHDVKFDLTDPANNGLIAASDFVKARSGMCLSCHDGVTTISNGVAMAAGVKQNFGRDLSENHNVGKSRTALADGSDALIRANDDQVVDAVTGVTKYYIGCGSCHSMHDSKTNLKLVRNAALVTGPVCLNCHSTK